MLHHQLRRLRLQRGWSRQQLAIRIQLRGWYVSTKTIQIAESNGGKSKFDTFSMMVGTLLDIPGTLEEVKAKILAILQEFHVA